MPRPQDLVPLRAARRAAPAKINLALHVTGRRADGYHELSSLIAFAAFGDALLVEPSGADALCVVGRFSPSLGDTPATDNIVLRALTMARRLGVEAGLAFGPAALTLDKRLPVAAGIGGGSADAAALLRMVADAVPELAEPLRSASLSLGADVPMCFDGRPAWIGGVGEIGVPLTRFPAVPCLLVNPGVPVSTRAVFAALRHTGSPALAGPSGFETLGGLAKFLGATANDLEAPALALAPSIGTARDALLRHGAAFARMSGSGATVFGLFETADAAEAAAAATRRDHPGWWVQPTRLMPADEED